ncbi:MAG TPA: ATP phosphoribosyltransferase regulatory subunit, partial [Leptospiraceae bacterium]|nr:ATP phosphoribosyltransferase regulatory subunit [Leptospiraceae bacterium]
MKNPELKERFKSWIPHGMEFIGPDQTERILAGCARLREAFAALGAREVIPPLLDFAPTFEMARQSEMASFQTRDMAGELLAFRSDLTVQIIKAAASGVFGQPGNYSYVQTIVLDAAAGSGHRRELLQAGIEFLGPADRRVETMIGLIADIRKDAIIVYGDTSFLRALLSGLSESDFAAAMKILDRKDIQGLRSFCEARSLQNSTAQILCELPFLSGASLDPLKQAAAGRS